MIGQKELIKFIDNQLDKGDFPRFSILVGSKGSGKKLLANYIAKKLSSNVIESSDTSISSIRELIDMSYKLVSTSVFIIADVDTMRLASKNSLLKVLEEPPHNAYWIMTVENIDNVLPTIRSRGTVFNMQPYSKKELSEYINSFNNLNGESKDIMKEICTTPGDINELAKINTVEFYSYVKLVADNIDKVSGANSFKISNKLSLKKDGEGYDLNLFWTAFKSECLKRMMGNILDTKEVKKWSEGMKVTSEFQNELGVPGINKQSLVDCWILDIRKKWL